MLQDVEEISQITQRLVDDYQVYAYRNYQGRNASQIQMDSLRNIMTAIKRFVWRLYCNDFIDYNPLDKMELPKKPRRLPKSVLDKEEVLQVFEMPLMHGLPGYGSIHGDGMQVSIDLCQHCFAGMCGDILTVTDPLDNLTTKSAVRKILSAHKISSSDELNIALKRVEQLWDAQFHSAEGNELHKLADLICAYENKSWDSYLYQEQASDDFMSERLSSIEGEPYKKSGMANGMLNNIPVNKDIDDDDSRQSSVDEEDTD